MKTHSGKSVLLFAVLFLLAAGGRILGSEISEKTIIKSNATTLVFSSWMSLLPKVVSCYMALAGENAVRILSHSLKIINVCVLLHLVPSSTLREEPPDHHLIFAGCHLCTFFLGTYHMSVAAPACTTSCSLAIFKTCSSLLAASLQQGLN